MDILRSTVPLQALHVSFASWAIDSDAPILDFLAAIPSLFSQLTQLSLTFLPFFCTRISCSRMDYSRSAIDHRSLELNDEEAFKGTPPADDISDDDSEDLPPITVKEQMRMNTVKAHSALQHRVGDSVRVGAL
jgi:hypothetical protein